MTPAAKPSAKHPMSNGYVDRRIGLPLLLTLFLQSAAGLIWAGAISQRVHDLERTEDGVSRLLERTARLEEQSLYVRASLERIEARIDKISNQTPTEEN